MLDNLENNMLDPKWGEFSAFHDPYVLANFKPRKSDVLITTAPKAGTTWMQQILYQLKSAGDEDFENIFHVVPWLEFPSRDVTSQQKLVNYESMSDPRLFKTHCTYPQTPGASSVQVILSSRDPRDCCVSFYHHLMSMNDNARQWHGLEAPGSFDSFFEDWMNAASWYNNVKSWWPHINDKNVLWLRYEDMVCDLEKCIDRILIFLNWTLTREQHTRVLANCHISWMKAHDHKFDPLYNNDELMFKPGGFVRKGVVGDYENLLSPKQAQCILNKANELLSIDCVKFLDIENQQ